MDAMTQKLANAFKCQLASSNGGTSYTDLDDWRHVTKLASGEAAATSFQLRFVCGEQVVTVFVSAISGVNISLPGSSRSPLEAIQLTRALKQATDAAYYVQQIYKSLTEVPK